LIGGKQKVLNKLSYYHPLHKQKQQVFKLKTRFVVGLSHIKVPGLNPRHYEAIPSEKNGLAKASRRFC